MKSDAEVRVENTTNGAFSELAEWLDEEGTSPEDREVFWAELEKILIDHKHLIKRDD